MTEADEPRARPVGPVGIPRGAGAASPWGWSERSVFMREAAAGLLSWSRFPGGVRLLPGAGFAAGARPCARRCSGVRFPGG